MKQKTEELPVPEEETPIKSMTKAAENISNKLVLSHDSKPITVTVSDSPPSKGFTSTIKKEQELSLNIETARRKLEFDAADDVAKELGPKLTPRNISPPIEKKDPLVIDEGYKRANYRTEQLINEVISVEDLPSKD